MQHIVVDDQEAGLIRAAGRSVQVLDAAGKVVGYITPAPPESEVDRVKTWVAEESRGPVFSTEQVLQRLRSLDNP